MLVKRRTYSDDAKQSNRRKSTTESIAIKYEYGSYNKDSTSYGIDSTSYGIDSVSYSNDSISYSIDSRSYSNDSRSYSIDSRSYSIDSESDVESSSFDESKAYKKKERKNSNPLLNFFKKHSDHGSSSENKKKTRLREMKLYSKSPDEPKTLEEVKKGLYIFDAKYLTK